MNTNCELLPRVLGSVRSRRRAEGAQGKPLTKSPSSSPLGLEPRRGRSLPPFAYRPPHAGAAAQGAAVAWRSRIAISKPRHFRSCRRPDVKSCKSRNCSKVTQPPSSTCGAAAIGNRPSEIVQSRQPSCCSAAYVRRRKADLLVQKDLDVVLGDKPEKMSDADWAGLDRKAMSVIRLSLTKNVAFNILKEKTAKGIMDALSNMYEKPSAANKVFLIRELVNTRMKNGTSVTEHINKLNSILARLLSVDIKFDDEVQTLLLLSSLPDSWSGTVIAVTGSVGPDGFTFDQIRDLVLGEDVRRKSFGESSGELLHVGRGGRNCRGRGRRHRRRSQSKTRDSSGVTCWKCKEVGHFRNQCSNDNKVNIAKGSTSDEDVTLTCCEESNVDSWVMDSGASFHATHSGEALQNLVIGDFGKIRLVDDRALYVTGMGDMLDEQGHEVKFRDGQWKAVKGNLVTARGKKRGSLYMDVPGSGSVRLQWEPVGTEDELGADLAVTDVLKLGRASMGLSVV
ncbi:unnamed protein product [Cuscuta campestris]|uniref:CCHC-type domain-containing protein n=1 Tax=Cuscuta campestris TaxID=132261 RepID=A0A484LRF7_9ASTE|nr:unnamed protein product [Cuscuta campestris]